MCRLWVASGPAWVSLEALEGAVRIMPSLVACLVGRSTAVAVRLELGSTLVAVGLELGWGEVWLEFAFSLGLSWRLVWSLV